MSVKVFLAAILLTTGVIGGSIGYGGHVQGGYEEYEGDHEGGYGHSDGGYESGNEIGTGHGHHEEVVDYHVSKIKQ